MPDSIVRAHSPLEFFKEHVEAACQHQQLDPQPLTSYYVVTLLTEFAHRGTSAAAEVLSSGEPLAVKLARALQSGGNGQRQELRNVGDVSLFVSGFFSDSLRRSLVDVDYYVSIGGYAYGSLSAKGDVLAPVFAELAEKFPAFVDVLAEVSDRTSLTSHSDVLRIYERWLRTGSRWNGDLLTEHGILPNESIRGSKSVH